jgi:nucleoside 2-deoxyribosyltransferase
MDQVLQNCFKPAVAQTGFELRALNETQPAGLIDNQIRAAIRRARFVVADLTHDNNGAYFEAGFAEGTGVPVIYTCERIKFEAKKTHFDTNHMVTIPWHVDALEEAGHNLTATIRATFPAAADRGS